VSLSAELGQRLNASGSITSLQGNTTTALGEMDNVSLPDMSADLTQAQQHSSGIDLSAITAGVQTALTNLTPALANLPVANDALGSINSALELAGKLSDLDLPNSIGQLATSIDEQLSGSGDYLGKIQQLVELLAGNASVQGASELIGAFSQLTGADFSADDLKVPALVPAIQSLVQLVGGLMRLQSGLEEGQRLADLVNDQLDAQRITAGIEHVEKQLAMDGELPLHQYLAGIDVNDAIQVATAKQAIANVATPLIALHRSVAEGMAFGEATLIHLDASNLSQGLQAAAQQLGSVDLSPLEEGVQRLAQRIEPLFRVDFSAAPAATLDDWLTLVEARVADIATGINDFDVDNITAPITDGIEAIMALPQTLTKALEALKLTVKQALDSIRTAIEAIPLDTVANAIRQVLEPIAEALAFVGDLVERIQAALNTAVGVLQGALDTAENAVDTVKTELDNLFQGVKGYIDQLNLEGVIGEVAQQIDNFVQLLAQADMSPFFDTVVDAINTTTGVVDKVPFEMLPDSMEQEVIDVIRPVKQVDVNAFKGQIENLLQIGPDGTFQLRPELENTLSAIQAKYDEVLETIRQADPHALLADINTELQKLQDRIETLTPSVALEPVQQAIDQIKAVIGDFDLNATLQPLSDGFNTVLEKVDEYKPSMFLQEVESKLSEAREAVFAPLQLERWTEELNKLRSQALELIDPLDPANLQPLLESVVGELQSHAADLPKLELAGALGSLFSAILGGSAGAVRAGSYASILEWMQNKNGTQLLGELARQASSSIDAARVSVQQVDPQAIILRLQPALNQVRTTLQTLPDGDGKTELLSCSVALNIETPLSGFAAQRQTYLATLQQASASFTQLANTGLSEVDIAVERLLNAFSPFNFARDLFRQLLGVIGVEGLEQGLSTIVNNVFAVATPQRLTDILQPIFTALKGRVENLLDGFFNPVIDAVADLQALKDQLSLASLMADLDSVHAAARAQIQTLHPDQLLGDTVSAFNDTQAQVLAFDPLGPLTEALTMLQISSVRVLDKLDGEEILKTPLAIYDDIMQALEQLDLEGLLTPVLDVLDTIAAKVDKGLDDTADSFSRLQQALPDKVGSTSISASASVSA